MTFGENLQHDVWNRLPAMKHLAGRRRVRRMVERAVREWPGTMMQICSGPQERQQLAEGLAAKVARDEYGSILVMVFIGLASAIVQVLLEWWLLGQYRRDFIKWKMELLT